MALSELTKKAAEKKLATYCDNKIPKHLQNEIRIVFKFHGNAAFLIESRPAYIGDGWTEMKIARFVFNETDRTWQLFCADRNDKWHPDVDAVPEKDIQRLLDIVEEDNTSIYWG